MKNWYFLEFSCDKKNLKWIFILKGIYEARCVFYISPCQRLWDIKHTTRFINAVWNENSFLNQILYIYQFDSLTMYQVDGSGKLGYTEFLYLWNLLRSWKVGVICILFVAKIKKGCTYSYVFTRYFWITMKNQSIPCIITNLCENYTHYERMDPNWFFEVKYWGHHRKNLVARKSLILDSFSVKTPGESGNVW